MEENKIIIYQTEDGQTQIDVRLENDTVWLNVTQMSALFDKEESQLSQREKQYEYYRNKLLTFE